ncbi:MAG: hypothetical protein VXW87_00210 [Pseudomonadota bacterium]|nr:hypothetical protein [Pseudomonadota bacterium]
MITYLLIILFCSALHWAIHIHWLSISVIGYTLLGLFPCIIISIAFDRFWASRHPLWQKVQSAIQNWEREHNQTIKHHNLILNFSTDDLKHLPEHQVQERISMRFGDCQLKGYLSSSGNFYLCLSHPENYIPDMIALWQQVQRTQIKFHHLFLCLNPTQLPHLDERLKNEWRYFTNIMKGAKNIHLLISDAKLTRAFYNIAEFGKLPPAITLDSYTKPKVTHILHRISVQIDHLIKVVFSQRHELCTLAPINPSQKFGIFQLSQSLAQMKQSILRGALGLSSHNIKLLSINFRIDDQTCKKPAPTFKGISLSPSKLTFPLTLAAALIFLLQFAIHKSVNHILAKADNASLPGYIMQLRHYPHFSSLQTHYTSKLKASLFKEIPSHVQPLYQQLFHYHNSPSQFKEWVVSSFSQSLLSEEEVHYFLPLWEESSLVIKDTNVSLSQIAMHIPKEHFENSCEILQANHTEQCVTNLTNIYNYQKSDDQLNSIQQTLLPIANSNPSQAIIQLKYLVKNPKQIGLDAYKRLDRMILEMKTQGSTHLVDKAKDIQSTINLLQSSNGQFILNQLIKVYSLLDSIHTAAEAHSFLAGVYQSDDHPLLNLLEIAKQLPKSQQEWLSQNILKLTAPLAHQTNQMLADHWNHHILPELDDILSLYPFDSASHDEVSSRGLYDVFGSKQLLDHFFQQFLFPFIQEDDHFLTLKDIPLGVDIPQSILMTMVYTQVIQSAMDIKPDHTHASWALSLSESPHPIEEVILYNGSQKLPLQHRQGVTLHWDSRYPVGFDIKLTSGKTISIVKDSNWSLLHLMDLFEERGKHSFQYNEPDHQWHIKIDLNPQHAIDLLTSDFITKIPHAPWATSSPYSPDAREVY